MYEQQLEELRNQRLLQEQKRQQQELLRRLLSTEARARLGNLRLANPEMASKVEMLIGYLYQNGQLKAPLTDEEFKALLERLTGTRRETKIRRM